MGAFWAPIAAHSDSPRRRVFVAKSLAQSLAIAFYLEGHERRKIKKILIAAA